MLAAVTVVIPCRDTGRCVAEAVESALASTYPDMRVLVVDDGSADPETLQILDALDRQKRPALQIVHRPHRGVAAARNEGVRLAQTPYLAFLDGDDLLARDYIEVCVRTLEDASARDPRIGFVYTDVILFGAAAGIWRLPDFSVYALLQQNFLPAPALMRREVWDTAGGYDERLRNFEDRDFWFRVVERGWTGTRAQATVYYYRQQPRQTGSRGQTDRSAREFYRLLAEIRHAHPTLFSPDFVRGAGAAWKGTGRDWAALQVRRLYQALYPFAPRGLLRWWRRRSLPGYLRERPPVLAMMPGPARAALGTVVPDVGRNR